MCSLKSERRVCRFASVECLPSQFYVASGPWDANTLDQNEEIKRKPTRRATV